MKEERWKDVAEHPGYEISDRGRVYSYFRGGGFLLGSPNAVGYPAVQLVNPRRFCTIHRLVAMAFIPNPLNCRCVNHKDGDKTNNHVDNLEWCTYSQNSKHAYEMGLNPAFKEKCVGRDKRGEQNRLTKLSNAQVLDIVKDKRIYKEIAASYGIAISSVGHIKNGDTWAHITGIVRKDRND